MSSAPAQFRAKVLAAAVLPDSLQPRGLARLQAAAYIGVSGSKFDELVADGRMPRPKQIDGRVVWDRRRLDEAFDNLPDAGGGAPRPSNDWDQEDARP